MTSHGVTGLKSLEPSCSAGGAGLGDAPASECLSLRQAATGGDDRVVIGRVMSLVLPTPSDRYLQFRLQDPGATGAHTALLFFAPAHHAPFFSAGLLFLAGFFFFFSLGFRPMAS